MNKYNVSDGNTDVVINANSAQEASEKYVAGGDWGELTETIWVHCRVSLLDDLGRTLETTRHAIQWKFSN